MSLPPFTVTTTRPEDTNRGRPVGGLQQALRETADNGTALRFSGDATTRRLVSAGRATRMLRAGYRLHTRVVKAEHAVYAWTERIVPADASVKGD